MTCRAIILPTAAAAVGWLAWSGPAAAICLAVVLPALWAAAGSRRQAAAVVISYQLVATKDLPLGIAAYYGAHAAAGPILWALAAAGVAGAWSALWGPDQGSWRPLRVAGALILTALPPLGVVGWVSPLTAAGILFPGWRWMGLFGTIGVIELLLLVPGRWLILAAVGLGCWGFLTGGPTKLEPGWAGIDTISGSTGGPDAMRKIIELPRLLKGTAAAVTLFPETAIGIWMPGEEQWWTAALGGARVALVGAEIVERDGRYANSLVEISASGARCIYKQRMPIPLTMWRPWANGGAHPYWFRNPVVQVANKRAAVLICYEEALVWPILCSFAAHPDIVLAASNDWWCPAGSAIPTIQRNAMTAWCRLFDLPLIMATNR
jgi:hypothetical protein